MSEHKHNYTYGGVIYALGGRLPGSGARERRYYDRFYCTECLHCRYIRLSETNSSYDTPLFNATPAPTGVELSA